MTCTGTKLLPYDKGDNRFAMSMVTLEVQENTPRKHFYYVLQVL